MDFAKLTKASDPLDVFEELRELDSWVRLPVHLQFLRNMRREIFRSEADIEAGVEVEYEPVYDFVPAADEVQRYFLYCYHKASTLGNTGDIARRRAQALVKAGVQSKHTTKPAWQLFIRFTDPLAGRMLAELLRLIQDKVYSAWLSDLIMLENLEIEQRAPVDGLEDDKKAAAYERKIKISIAKPDLHLRIDTNAAKLFAGDADAEAGTTTSALGQRETDFKGGYAEKMAGNVK